MKISNMSNLQNQDYKNWITALKQKVYSTQIKASIAVNKELIEFYFFLGKSISGKEKVWGAKLLEQISMDLTSEFPDMKGFSVRNLKYCRNFYTFYAPLIGQQPVAQLQNTEFQNNNQNNEISQQTVDQLNLGGFENLSHRMTLPEALEGNILRFPKATVNNKC